MAWCKMFMDMSLKGTTKGRKEDSSRKIIKKFVAIARGYGADFCKQCGEQLTNAFTKVLVWGGPIS